MLLPKKILRSWPIDRVCPALLFGLLLASFCLMACCQKCDFESVREHMNLIVSLNRGIRGALGAVAVSAMSEDRSARLKGIDEATGQIDTMLCDPGTARRSESTKLCALNRQSKPSGPAAAQPQIEDRGSPPLKANRRSPDGAGNTRTVLTAAGDHQREIVELFAVAELLNGFLDVREKLLWRILQV